MSNIYSNSNSNSNRYSNSNSNSNSYSNSNSNSNSNSYSNSNSNSYSNSNSNSNSNSSSNSNNNNNTNNFWHFVPNFCQKPLPRDNVFCQKTQTPPPKGRGGGGYVKCFYPEAMLFILGIHRDQTRQNNCTSLSLRKTDWNHSSNQLHEIK